MLRAICTSVDRQLFPTGKDIDNISKGVLEIFFDHSLNYGDRKSFVQSVHLLITNAEWFPGLE